jgi:transposase
MSQGYLNTLSKIFPAAKFIVDRYHVVQSMNDKLDKYRQEIRDAETDKTWNRTLFDVRNLLKMDYEDILIKSNAYRAGDKDAWEFHYDPKYKLEQLFKRYPNLEKAFDIKEAVRFLYRCKDRHDAAEHFLRLEAAVKAEATGMGTKLFVGAIRNLKRWMPYILNWIGAPMTNGFTESMNEKIKLVEKVGRGYSFDTLRYKALFGSRIKHYNPSKIDLKLSKWSPSTTMRDFTTFDLFAPETEHITFLEANYHDMGYEFAPFPIEIPEELQRL